jgi:hypothetical protein
MNRIELDRHRKEWNTRQTWLRKMLTGKPPDPRAIPVFLTQHAAIHSGRLDPGGFSFQDEALRGLREEDLRRAPKRGGHSIIWILWHITRIEDVTLNRVVAESGQVFRRGGWRKKLGVPFEDVGNDMPVSDLAVLDRRMNVRALLSYRLAVGRRTRRIVQSIRWEDLLSRVAPDCRSAVAGDGVVRPKAAWLIDFWCGRRKADVLMMPPTRHSLVHWNEVVDIRRWLERQEAATGGITADARPKRGGR